MKPAAVIPARFGASRFPGKPLAFIAGKTMVQRVFEQCLKSEAFSRVLVATEDERIVQVVKGFGGEAVMTSPSCATGTDRVAEVARAHPDLPILINVQGDEPVVHPESLRTLASAFEDPTVTMATLVRPLAEDERPNPNIVKVVLKKNGDALYFSRSDIPFQREASDLQAPPRWAHLGLYGFKRELLLEMASWPETALERSERLEQLRALENGVSIRCLQTPHQGIAVDVPSDVQRVEAFLKSTGQA